MEFFPVTPERWSDLVRLFAHHGNPGYCWCMLWRVSSREYREMYSAGRQNALEDRLRSGLPIGILGYQDGEPVGWCSIAPRETYQRLERSTSIQRIDDQKTWSVVCFFLDRRVRGQGFTLALLKAAVEYARSQGAEVVEGYPVEPRRDVDGVLRPPASYRFMGYKSTFRKAGFLDHTPPGKGRAVMRYIFTPDSAGRESEG